MVKQVPMDEVPMDDLMMVYSEPVYLFQFISQTRASDCGTVCQVEVNGTFQTKKSI